MSAAPIRTKPEPDTRPCFVCDKPIEYAAKWNTGGESHAYAIAIHPATGEFRWIHATCGLNHHVAGKRRRRWVTCANCGQTLRGEHADYSGESFTAAAIRAAAPPEYRAEIADDAQYSVGGYAVCRDGGLFVRGRDVVSEVPATRARVHTDLDAFEFPPDTLNEPTPDDHVPEHVPPF